MNIRNLEDIRSGLRALGFGDKLYPDLETSIAQGKPRMTFLHKTRINGQEMASSIHLEKSAQSDKYRISKYDTMIKKIPDHYENKVQTFFISKNQGVTLKEAFNLLDGRSVLKPSLDKKGKVERNWLQLDFKKEDRAGNSIVNQYAENHGFDLSKTLHNLPVREVKTVQGKEMLLRSLEKGNRESVTLTRAGVNEKIFIEADPGARTINLYDRNQKKMEVESVAIHQAADQRKQGVKNTAAERLERKPNNDLAGSSLRRLKSIRKGLSH